MPTFRISWPALPYTRVRAFNGVAYYASGKRSMRATMRLRDAWRREERFPLGLKPVRVPADLARRIDVKLNSAIKALIDVQGDALTSLKALSDTFEEFAKTVGAPVETCEGLKLGYHHLERP